MTPGRIASLHGVTPERRSELAALRRARDLMDRRYAEPLDVPAIAAAVFMSSAHFSRRFRAVYGETPHSYLMTRRIERACALLRAGSSVTEACVAVGCTSLGSFSSRFTTEVGMSPSAYRAAEHGGLRIVPDCTARVIGRRPRTSRIGEAAARSAV